MNAELTKLCTLCKQLLPVSMFYLVKNRKGERVPWTRCKECGKAEVLAWRANNLEKAKAIDLASRKRHRTRRRAYCREWYEKNKERAQSWAVARNQALKDAAYAAYGGYRCVCCGETEPVFLNLDHVNNDGSAHRKTFRSTIYNWLKQHSYPPGMFQVMCANCNQGRARNGGICPHQQREALYKPLTITEV